MVKRIKNIIAVLGIDSSFWLFRNWVKLILILGLASWLTVLSFPDNKVRIIYCNAGQGDETLIQRGFMQILIDGSRPGRALDCLKKHVPFFDRQIELMVVSHPQIDHFGGLTDVVKRYKVMSFVYNGIKGNSREWEEFSKLVLEEGAKIETVVTGDEIGVGGMKLKVLWPKKETIDDRKWKVGVEDRRLKIEKSNPSSTFHPLPLSSTIYHPPSNVLGVSSPGELNSSAVVMDFSYGDFNALFTGDIGEEEEREIIRLSGYQVDRLENTNLGSLLSFEPVNLSSIDVLKVAHHGSKYSSSLEFLKAIRPALAVIEVGKNSYGHPTAEAIERLKEVGAKILRTDQDGEVVVETDGKKWGVINK